jgi:hypothetical protein
MNPENFQKLLDDIYKDTFTVEFGGKTWEFKQKLPAEVSLAAKTGKSGQNQEQMIWKIVSQLSVNPKLTVKQVAELPEDFYTKVYLQYSDFLDQTVKDKAKVAQQTLIAQQKT